MPSALDRMLSGSPYGFNEPGQINSSDMDPDAMRQALLAIARGAIAEPIAGAVGVGSLPWGVDQAVSNLEGVQKAIGYQPEDADTFKYIAQIAEPMTEWMSENIGDLRTKAGEATLEVTGSEGLAALAHSAPEVLGAIATGGMMVPAVRAASKAVPEGPDMGRRKAMRTIGAGAGLMGAAAVAPKLVGKSLMDAPVASAGMKAAPAAVSAVAKAIPRAAISVTPSTMRMMGMLRSYPLLLSAFKKGGKDGFIDEINKPETELGYMEDAMPYIESDNDFYGVEWDKVGKYVENDDNIDWDIDYGRQKDKYGREGNASNDMNVEKYVEDYPKGMRREDVHQTFMDLSDTDPDFEDILNRKDYNTSLKEAINDLDNYDFPTSGDKRTLDTLNDMIKDKDSYQEYLNYFEGNNSEYGEYRF